MEKRLPKHFIRPCLKIIQSCLTFLITPTNVKENNQQLSQMQYTPQRHILTVSKKSFPLSEESPRSIVHLVYSQSITRLLAKICWQRLKRFSVKPQPMKSLMHGQKHMVLLRMCLSVWRLKCTIKPSSKRAGGEDFGGLLWIAK
ncbi:hypothetical protein D3C81_1431760 [compost metagenome]